MADDVKIVGVFSQNGFGAIKPGAKVQMAFANNPGRLYDISMGVEECVIAGHPNVAAQDHLELEA